MNPSIKEILVEYLQANGYDGLAGDGCGCAIDDDLGGCEYPDLNLCQAGYIVPLGNRPKDCPALGEGCMSLTENMICDGTEDCPL